MTTLSPSSKSLNKVGSTLKLFSLTEAAPSGSVTLSPLPSTAAMLGVPEIEAGCRHPRLSDGTSNPW